MDAVVDDFGPVDAVFLLQIRIEAGLDILNYGFPAGDVSEESQTSTGEKSGPIVVVDEVAEPRGIDDCEMETNTILLDVC